MKSNAIESSASKMHTLPEFGYEQVEGTGIAGLSGTG